MGWIGGVLHQLEKEIKTLAVKGVDPENIGWEENVKIYPFCKKGKSRGKESPYCRRWWVWSVTIIRLTPKETFAIFQEIKGTAHYHKLMRSWKDCARWLIPV